MKQRLEQFLTQKTTQVILASLIVISTSAILLDLYDHEATENYVAIFRTIEYITVAVFTVEFALRLWAAPQRWQFMKQPMSIVDILAIVPSYAELALSATPAAAAIRSLRLLRFLRLSRLLQAFKLFRYRTFFKHILKYNETILQSITPVLAAFAGLKILLMALERYNLWITETNLQELFAIIGFSLGIILSQKIGTTSDKFTQVEEATVRITSTLLTLQAIAPKSLYKEWADLFLQTLHAPTPQHQAALHSKSHDIFEVIHTMEPQPSDITILYRELLSDTNYCISKAKRLTPQAYDTLLHQATVVYLLLITLFLPGVTGLISVAIATYLLYGMYRVTQDLDSVVEGEYKLININISELQQFAHAEPTPTTL